MSLVEELLISGAGLRDVAQQLGVICLDHEGDIYDEKDHDSPRWKLAERCSQAVASISPYPWAAIASGEAPVRVLLDAPGVADALRRLTPPLGAYAILRPLSRYGLGAWFGRTTDVVRLRHGDAFPFVERPLHGVRERLPPRHSTTTRGNLLERTGFRLWDRVGDRRIAVELDYSCRGLLDAIGWHPERGGAGPFPLVVTLHPYADWDELELDGADGRFFNVRPKAFPKDRILRQLRACATADIAVLPELSLPSPDALASSLAREPRAYPRIVVAGSAHVTEPDGRRRNRSITYLDGKPRLHHDKVHPAVYRAPIGAGLREELTAGRVVLRCLSSKTTRLAVVICADLNDDEIPKLLLALGVNLLLVPALTPHEGAFQGTVSSLAALLQGVSIVVNGSPPPADSADPFMVLAGVPSYEPHEQVRAFGPPPWGRRAVGWLDVNRPLSAADPWGRHDGPR